jgi:holo-[acyl-carrier protein] synthase
MPHYAARFAAKEAACKALGIGLTPLGIDRALQDIEVVRHGRAPTLALRGRPGRHARRLGVTSRSVSLSHAGSGALASVVLLTQGTEEGHDA